MKTKVGFGWFNEAYIHNVTMKIQHCVNPHEFYIATKKYAKTLRFWPRK